MTSFTAPWSFPPSVANSFWYSMKTKAVSHGSKEKSAILKSVFDLLLTLGSTKADADKKREIKKTLRIMIDLAYWITMTFAVKNDEKVNQALFYIFNILM